MKCYACGADLIWGGDEEDDEDSEFEIMTSLHCPECESVTFVFHSKKTYGGY